MHRHTVFFVFVIDEWDCIFHVKGEDTEAQKLYLNFLRDLLKNQPYCILAYMTGILPIKKYGEHSALNMFDEYSMTNQRELAEFTGFTGFTEQEVQKEFINCIEDGGWEPVMDAIRKSEKLLAATIRGEEETVARMIENAHQENTSILAYNDENSLACVISLAYYSAKKNYVVYRELAGGKGFADMVFVPRKTTQTPAIVVELKWNKTAEAAITQIKRKQYVESLKDHDVIMEHTSRIDLSCSVFVELAAVMCNAVSGYYDLVKCLFEEYQGIRYKSIPLFFQTCLFVPRFHYRSEWRLPLTQCCMTIQAQ